MVNILQIESDDGRIVFVNSRDETELERLVPRGFELLRTGSGTYRVVQKIDETRDGFRDRADDIVR